MTSHDGFSILAVCSGNICRSPFVELILGGQLKRESRYLVSSAGTIARPGQHMTVEMVNVASHYGVPPSLSSAHSAARLTERQIESADLILGLTREHRARSVEESPAAIGRVFTLKEFARLAGHPSVAGERPARAGELVALAASRRAEMKLVDPSADDIEDPIGQPQAVYDRVGEEITRAVAVIADVLLGHEPLGRGRPIPVAVGPTIEPDLSFSFRRL